MGTLMGLRRIRSPEQEIERIHHKADRTAKIIIYTILGIFAAGIIFLYVAKIVTGK